MRRFYQRLGGLRRLAEIQTHLAEAANQVTGSY